MRKKGYNFYDIKGEKVYTNLNVTFVEHIFPFGNDYETKMDFEDTSFVESLMKLQQVIDNDNELWENHTSSNVHEDTEHELESEHRDEGNDVDLGIENEDGTNTHYSLNRETTNHPRIISRHNKQQMKNDKALELEQNLHASMIFFMDLPPSLEHLTIVPTSDSSTVFIVHPISHMYLIINSQNLIVIS